MDRKTCEEKAEGVRREYNPLDLSPFPYQNVLIKNSDLSINFFSFTGELEKEKLSGAITLDKRTDGEHFNISINNSHSDTRQHFTLAHELGHYFLHKDIIRKEGIIVDTEFFDGNRALFRQNEPQNISHEIEANCFAAALIMPSELVEKAWKELGRVEECARVFNVSVSAMSIRLERLKILLV